MIKNIILVMEKLSGRNERKNKKPSQNAKSKTTKKRKCEGPTCSLFLSELTRKFANKKKLEDDSKNVVQSVIESISNALPVKLLKKSPEKAPSPVKMESLQAYAPELIPNDMIINVTSPMVVIHDEEDIASVVTEDIEMKTAKAEHFKMPKMPLINSEILRVEATRYKKNSMQDEAVNTGPNNDVASEIVKHVNTLRKISLIAEEFNQKTAKNLKEILDSVQEDLIKKLEELSFERPLPLVHTVRAADT